MADALVFKKAERSKQKLKVGIQGPSGSGKTLAALLLAVELAKSAKDSNGRVAVIDSENESASLYSDVADFDTLPIGAPYLSDKYKQAIAAAANAGYGAVVVDSLSHQWAGEGGVLTRKDAEEARGGNGFTLWAKYGKEHTEFMAFILAAKIHLVATLRSKAKYVVEKNAKGKDAPRKVGMEAIMRDGSEYELSLNFQLEMDHLAMASKDRTRLFDGRDPFPLVDARANKSLIAADLIGWLSSGKELAPEPSPFASLEEVDALVRLMVHPSVPEGVRDAINGKLANGEPKRATYDKWMTQLTACVNEASVSALSA